MKIGKGHHAKQVTRFIQWAIHPGNVKEIVDIIEFNNLGMCRRKFRKYLTTAWVKGNADGYLDCIFHITEERRDIRATDNGPWQTIGGTHA